MVSLECMENALDDLSIRMRISDLIALKFFRTLWFLEKKRTNKNKKEMKKEMIASYKNLGILKNYFIEFNIERKKILFLKICLRIFF